MKKISHLLSLLVFLTYKTCYAQCEADTIVILNNFEFVPSELVLTPGQTVAFINLEGIHSVNGINNSITGDSFNNPADFFLNDTLGNFEGVCMGVIEFETPGIYNFDSSVGFDANAEMNLQITVDAFDLADLIQTIGLFNSPWAFQYYLPFPYMTDSGPWTLFVPNDQAVTDILAYMSLGQFDALAIPDFPEILEYHISPGLWLEEDLYDGLALLSAQGQDLNISETNGALFVEDAQIISTNYSAYNGVIHVIDKCLAPNNLPGAHVMQVITESPNHEILESAIIELALNDELSFQATIDDSYDGPGPWTVFAPTDAAFQVFAEMMGMTITELLDSQFLYSIISQHIINGCVDDFNLFYEIDEDCFSGSYPALESSNINSGTIATNLDNESLQFIVTDTTLSVIGEQNTVNIIESDLFSYNGVVHVIDAIIEPKLPEVNPGSCGLWSVELNTTSSEGWSGSQLEIVINNVQIQTAILLEGNQESTYEFGMNVGDVLDLIYFPGSSISSQSYKLFDGNNDLVLQTAGNTNNYGPSGFEGITACDNPKETCGKIEIQLTSEFGYGWYFAEMNVYRNGEFERSIEMPSGYSQYTSFTSYYGDSFDFYPNLNPALFYPEEYGYKVYDNNGNTLVDENSLNESPESVSGISICSSNVSIQENQNIDYKLVKMFDLLGREQTFHSSGNFLFYLYENGEIRKVIR